ncbi:MAG: NADH-quinone oxidoreductase subunit J [Chloroflexota bacterium]|nr:MAG: NADH-quinone oxidoreductase subunit J [Chloroflexota bacterium]
MGGETVFFVVVAIIAVLAGIGVVAARRVVHSAVLLALNLLSVAVLFVTLNAQFLAAVQALIYAGAVMVLFLFAIILLPIVPSPASRSFMRRAGFALGLSIALLVEVMAAVLLFANGGLPELPASSNEVAGSPEAIGQLLFTDYLFPFEVASVLLLVAIVGAMVLAGRRR